MKYLTPFRLACYFLLFFCAAHTAGGMLAQKSLGPASDAVFTAMKAVHFDFNGSNCTWYGFWFAFGLTASVFLLLSAVVAWQLDKVPVESWPAVSVIAWALAASHVANAVLTWAYFFAGAALTATVVAALLVAGALRKDRMASANRRAA